MTQTTRRILTIAAGMIGLAGWIVLSYGDAESGPEPLLGWHIFDEWQMTSNWLMFFLVPAICFLIPAGTVWIVCRFFGPGPNQRLQLTGDARDR